MAFIDKTAANALRRLREDRGLSPEALAAEIRAAARTAEWGERGCVDAHTIRRIERRGHVPGTRVQFVLAHFYGVDRRAIWDAENREAAIAA